MDTWGFDANTGECKNFHFMCENTSDQASNMNRFENRDICQKYCNSKQMPQGRSVSLVSYKLDLRSKKKLK